jgi:hypothetical protein
VADSRLTLKGQQVVRPLDDRFRFRPSGDEGPAGWWMLVAFDYTYPQMRWYDEKRWYEEMRGEAVLQEIGPGTVESITGALLFTELVK